MQVYDVDSGLEILSLGGHKDLIQSLRFSPDGRRLAAGSYQVVTLWNVPTGGLKATFTGHGDQVKAVAVVGDGRTLVSGGPRQDDPLLERPTASRSVNSEPPARCWPWRVSPDGSRLAVGGRR